jgi:hypothetical protein
VRDFKELTICDNCQTPRVVKGVDRFFRTYVPGRKDEKGGEIKEFIEITCHKCYDKWQEKNPGNIKKVFRYGNIKDEC